MSWGGMKSGSIAKGANQNDTKNSDNGNVANKCSNAAKFKTGRAG